MTLLELTPSTARTDFTPIPNLSGGVTIRGAQTTLILVYQADGAIIALTTPTAEPLC